MTGQSGFPSTHFTVPVAIVLGGLVALWNKQAEVAIIMFIVAGIVFTYDVVVLRKRSQKAASAPPTSLTVVTQMSVGQGSISVCAGRIETIPVDSTSLVILPANECFDDTCFSDPNTAAGAFITTHYRQVPEFRAALTATLQRDYPNVVPGGRHELGTTAYLPYPGSYGLLLAAVVQPRPGGNGEQADPGTLFAVVRAGGAAALHNRLRHVYIPVIGAGRGSLPLAMALLVQLIAWAEFLHANSGAGLHVHIVVFGGSGAVPVTHRRAKELVAIVTRAFQT